MAKTQKGWRKVASSGHGKVEKMAAGDDCAAHWEFVAVAVICRAQMRKVEVLVYIKTWRLTEIQSVDSIAAAWVAVERGTR